MGQHITVIQLKLKVTVEIGKYSQCHPPILPPWCYHLSDLKPQLVLSPNVNSFEIIENLPPNPLQEA